MITLEEINKRIDIGPEDFEIKDTSSDWSPEELENYVLPDFVVDIPAKGIAKKAVLEQLPKVLTFINFVQRKRYKGGCTIMPIARTSNQYLWIWGYEMAVGRAIAYMEKIGLIKLYKKKKHYGKSGKSYSYKYLYFYDNEQKFIKFCEDNGIESYICKNAKDIQISKRNLKYIDFDETDVRFGSKLMLIKPDELSRTEFENVLLYCLYKNYPMFRLWQEKADEINDRFYKTNDEIYKKSKNQKSLVDFAIRFRPKFHWNDKGLDIVEGIGIRATNSFCNKKDKDSDEREQVKKEYGFILDKDIKSSVPRLTLSINKGRWIDEKDDIYKLINDEFDPGSTFNDERRQAIKNLHMCAYFDEGSKEYIGKNVWFRMQKSGAIKSDVDDAMGKLKEAIIKAEGGRTFGSEIFYVESVVYLMTLYDLLCAGILTWLVYDCFYSRDFANKEFFVQMVQDQVKLNFQDFVEHEKYFKKLV